MELSPHGKHEASPIETARIAASKILDHLGVESDAPLSRLHGAPSGMVTATVGLEHTQLSLLPDVALPTVHISQPTGKFAESARFTHDVAYKLHGRESLFHILLLKDGEDQTAEMVFDDERPARPLHADEAEYLAADLTRLADTEA